MLTESDSSKISFLGFKVNTEEPPNVKGEFFLRKGEERVVFQEPQAPNAPVKIDSGFSEFSPEMV